MAQSLYPLNYGLDDLGNWVRFQTGARDLSHSKASRSALEITHLSIQRVAKSVAVAQRVAKSVAVAKRPGPERDH